MSIKVDCITCKSVIWALSGHDFTIDNDANVPAIHCIYQLHIFQMYLNEILGTYINFFIDT